jgi:hypothetical protein
MHCTVSCWILEEHGDREYIYIPVQLLYANKVIFKKEKKHLESKDKHRLKVKSWKKIYWHENIESKQQ